MRLAAIAYPHPRPIVAKVPASSLKERNVRVCVCVCVCVCAVVATYLHSRRTHTYVRVGTTRGESLLFSHTPVFGQESWNDRSSNVHSTRALIDNHSITREMTHNNVISSIEAHWQRLVSCQFLRTHIIYTHTTHIKYNIYITNVQACNGIHGAYVQVTLFVLIFSFIFCLNPFQKALSVEARQLCIAACNFACPDQS